MVYCSYSGGDRASRNLRIMDYYFIRCSFACQSFFSLFSYFFRFQQTGNGFFVLSARCIKTAPAMHAGAVQRVKSLAEFRARRRERASDHFSRRRVRREKYTPACKCAGCPHLADSSCAQQAAACCRITPKEFFDSLNSPGNACRGCFLYFGCPGNKARASNPVSSVCQC